MKASDQTTQLYNRNLVLFLSSLLIVMTFLVYELVYATGGIKYVYSHSMYFPILLAGYFLGPIGGGLIGLLGSILLGPFMPIDTITQEQQQTLNWIYRSFYFISAGVLVGYGVGLLRKRMDEIRYLANNDRDTGLPNRSSTIKYLSTILALPAQQKSDYVLMKVSCDNLMDIEVAFGFEASDSVVAQMHERLNSALPPATFLSRTHRSEFAALIKGMSQGEVAALANGVNESFKCAFSHRDIPLHVESSIGYLHLSERSEDPDRVLQMAEVALMRARNQHHHVVAYDHASHKVSRDNLALLGELRNAVGADQLRLHYQPKLLLADNSLVGAEALMRWEHPERGMIPPDQFIPQAEKSSIINELTVWALRSAVTQQSQWCAMRGMEQLKVAVNISVHDLMVPGFHDVVLQTLEQGNLDNGNLELEVTESALMEDIATSVDVLKRLSGANVIISIDDFGTGYSSLKYLDLLPTAAIKIDQSFVFRMARDAGSRQIVQAAIGLAHSLGMRVIAEGVETEENYSMLRDMGCDIAQGFFISRPLASEKFPGFSFQQQ
ncbi:putative bifunctional diguanylate cyclase/phosphodiesterase [Mariprofundus ferrooxydans]|uniref:putative bifunctional diguanylate cyclase/phosphodiesterase n=1 Tax=Mariprofundus ferrooxydans TaxID=314344 RepID=UPI00142FEB59|nr:bifunctional diguanylate cyclase/phosphodiesterase [Mariprofundus ferrooxydans]